MMAFSTVYVQRALPKKEDLAPGHRACLGCGEALAVRQACKAFLEDTIIVNATGCIEIFSSPIPFTSWRVPWIHVLFENTAAVASGVESAFKVRMRKGKCAKRKVNVVAMAGDGGTNDIGLQALSGAFERRHKLTYLCFDNEAYMNTGIQRSSATPYGASTTTSPAGKLSIGQRTWKKDMPKIAVAHDIPYVATACPSYPIDLVTKVRKGMAANGPAYIHILSPCPTGWGFPSDLTVQVGRLAVETGIFPLYEVENGEYKIDPDLPKLRPIKDYLMVQRRFRHLSPEEVERIQEEVSERYLRLRQECRK